MEEIKKKLIPGKTAVKAFINGFVSYGIIFSFIIIFTIALFNLKVPKNAISNEFNYMIIISLIKSILLFFLLLLLCRISTFDVLKKCKINKNDIEKINKNMTIFFIICTLFSIMIFTFNLSIKYLNMKTDLYQISTYNYNSFKDSDINIATALTDIETKNYKDNWFKYKVCASIIEVSIIASCIYLIKYQPRMIELYNT